MHNFCHPGFCNTWWLFSKDEGRMNAAPHAYPPNGTNLYVIHLEALSSRTLKLTLTIDPRRRCKRRILPSTFSDFLPSSCTFQLLESRPDWHWWTYPSSLVPPSLSLQLFLRLSKQRSLLFRRMLRSVSWKLPARSDQRIALQFVAFCQSTK